LVIACQSGDDDGRGDGLEQHHGHWLKIYFSYQQMMNDGLVTMDDESRDAKLKSVCEKHDQNLLVELLGAGRMI
jgi:hypothetical protein